MEDTIGATLAEPLVIEVLDAHAHPIPGDSVRIEAPFVGVGVPIAFFGVAPDSARQPDYQTTTDAQGMVRAYVRLYTMIGAFYVVATTGDFRDSVSITIQPGAPFRLNFSPRDTAIYVGASYSLQSRPFDRANNPTPAPVVLRAARPQVADADANHVIRAQAIGRAEVVATSGSVTDSVAVSVVPQGRVVAYSGTLGTFVMLALDGSVYQPFAMSGDGNGRGGPYFFADGQRIVYQDLLCRTRASCLLTLSVQGAVDTLLTPMDSIPQALMPQPSRDGSWVYFMVPTGYEEAEVWRVAGPGMTPMRVSPVSTLGDEYTAPAPSPDGSSLAVRVDRLSLGQGVHLAIMSVATGQTQVIATASRAPASPRWSPVGDEIAFFSDSGFAIDRSDGQRLFGPIVPPPGVGWDNTTGQIDWSGDGKWLIACIGGGGAGDHLVVIDRATGELLPLAFTAGDRLCAATWQP